MNTSATTRYMWRSIFVALCLVTVFALIAVACSGDSTPAPEPEPPLTGDEVTLVGGPPQLVTENYLREQIALDTARTWGGVVSAMASYNGSRTRVVDVTPSKDFTSDPTITVQWVINIATGFQRHYEMTIRFGGGDYDPDGGSVTQGDCKKRPGAGVATTGEFSDIDNQTGEPLEHKISKTVTESDATSMSLDQSFEFSNKTTVEGGVDFGAGSGSVSNEFSATWGIDSSQTQDHSTETSVTVEDTITVDPGHEIYVAFTTDDAAIDCATKINAAADWSDIEITIDPVAIEERGKSHGRAWDLPLHISNNGRILWGSGLLNDNKMTFTEADDLWRAAQGKDTRCFDCHFAIDRYAQHDLDTMADPSSRWISLDATRHQVTKKDASYKVIDLAGKDEDCVRKVVETAGNDLDDAEAC